MKAGERSHASLLDLQWLSAPCPSSADWTQPPAPPLPYWPSKSALSTAITCPVHGSRPLTYYNVGGCSWYCAVAGGTQIAIAANMKADERLHASLLESQLVSTARDEPTLGSYPRATSFRFAVIRCVRFRRKHTGGGIPTTNAEGIKANENACITVGIVAGVNGG